MRMREIFSAGLPILMALGGCAHPETAATSNAANAPNSVTVAAPSAADIERMRRDKWRIVAAMQSAHDTLPAFIRALRKPKASQSGFAVKGGIANGSHVQHVWLNGVTFDGKKFHGVLDNHPAAGANAKPGDKIAVAASEVSDWMYIENHKLVGGYTVRAMRDGLSPQDKKRFDKSLPFIVD